MTTTRVINTTSNPTQPIPKDRIYIDIYLYKRIFFDLSLDLIDYEIDYNSTCLIRRFFFFVLVWNDNFLVIKTDRVDVVSGNIALRRYTLCF